MGTLHKEHDNELRTELTVQDTDARIVLLAREGAARKKYEDVLTSLGVQVETVSSFQELYAKLRASAYNGVVIDLLVKLRAPQHEKDQFMDLADNFPVLQLNYEEQTGEVRSFYFSKLEGAESLEDFINKECRNFTARIIRSSPRKKIHYNALLTRADGPADYPVEKSFTVDVSKGGCFLFSAQSWEMNETVFFTLKELSDQTSIAGEVRWKREWGVSMHIPGIGVEFKRITEKQLAEISNRL